MSMNTEHILPIVPGCYIDSHAGHYAIPDMISLATALGFHVDPFVQYALDRYSVDCHNEEYPGEALIEVSDEALEWLNESERPWYMDGHGWAWNDGDFGFYRIEDVD